MVKRMIDILVSAAFLIVSSPLILCLAIWIKLDSKGPVFYRGTRIGRNGKPFGILKLRSMVVSAEAMGGTSISDTDARVTRAGLFIRRHKFDELPQFWNVLTGSMSLVGPRPEVKHYVDMLTEEERAVLTIRPGITDWATLWNSNQGAYLSQFADAETAYREIIRPTKVRLQLEYVRNRSLLVDIKILWFTFLRIVGVKALPSELRSLPRLDG